jgi:hypothetical protein
MENEKVKYKWFRDAINWISTSFQNSRGKVCSKRTTVFALTLLTAEITIFQLSNPNAIAALGMILGTITAILGVKDYFERKNKTEKTEEL